jgi:hypothetical protein
VNGRGPLQQSAPAQHQFGPRRPPANFPAPASAQSSSARGAHRPRPKPSASPPDPRRRATHCSDPVATVPMTPQSYPLAAVDGAKYLLHSPFRILPTEGSAPLLDAAPPPDAVDGSCRCAASRKCCALRRSFPFVVREPSLS